MWERPRQVHHRRLRLRGRAGRLALRTNGRRPRRPANTGAVSRLRRTCSNEGKNKEAEEAFARIGPKRTVSSYRMLARFREAGELARRDAKAAVAIYDQLAADKSHGTVLQDLAAVRAGTVLVDTASDSDIRNGRNRVAAQDRAFRHTARSVLAFSAPPRQRYDGDAPMDRMFSGRSLMLPGTRGQIQMLLALSDSDKKS